jgi:hypothetical protein
MMGDWDTIQIVDGADGRRCNRPPPAYAEERGADSYA